MKLLLGLLVAFGLAPDPLAPDERGLFETAIARQLEGNLDQAEEGYRRVLAARPLYQPARLYLAQTLWLEGRAVAARRELDAVIAEHPDLLLGRWLSWRFGESGPAPLLDKIQSIYPFETQRFAATGTPALVLLSLGEVELAYEDYRRAAALDPGDEKLHRQLGEAFFEVRHALAASEAFERVAASRPRDASALRKLGASYLLLQRWSSAIESFERSIELGGEDKDVLLATGYAYERRSFFDEALERYHRASELAPDEPEPRLRMGRCYLTTNQLEHAERELLRASRIDPDGAESFRFLGELYFKGGELVKAVDFLERAVELDPDYFEAYYHLAQSYLRSGRSSDAKRALETYEKLKREKRNIRPQEYTVGRRVP